MAETNIAELAIGVAGSLGGVFLGYWLSEKKRDSERVERQTANWAAIRAEIVMCGKQAC